MKRSLFPDPDTDPDAPIRVYRDTPEHPLPPSRHYPGMAEEASGQIHAVLSGKVSVDGLSTWCSEAEIRWPGIGWGLAAMELRERKRGVNPAYLAPWRQERMRSRAILESWEPTRIDKSEVEQQKSVILGMNGQPVADGVPF